MQDRDEIFFLVALVGVSVWDVGAVYQNFTGFWGGGRGIVRERVMIHASRRKVFFCLFYVS